MTHEEILKIITQNAELKNLPIDQLNWLISNASVRDFDKGEYLFRASQPADNLYIILSGQFNVYIERNGSKQEVTTIEVTEITGVLPYSRMKVAGGFGQATQPSKVLSLHRDLFKIMICEHHELTDCFVHHMTNRVRNFTALQQQNEKLMSLGKLSAGLAHELNNPAAAIVRSADALRKHLNHVPEKFKQVMKMKVDDGQIDFANDIILRLVSNYSGSTLSMLQRSECEDALADRMEEMGIENAFELAEILVEYNFTEDDLAEFEANIPMPDAGRALHWLATNLSTEKMVQEIGDAAKRISSLVGSVKNYTHMDRANDKQQVNLHEGIRSTVTMLGHKFRSNKVQLIEDFGPIPSIHGFPGEINQVFTNIIDNALDAMESGGTLTIRTIAEKEFVKVEVEDSGTGIPEEIQAKIFDPFYTTKEIGKGTGLGLDVVLKIMKQRHRGDIKVTSSSGKTVFTLCFPILG